MCPKTSPPSRRWTRRLALLALASAGLCAWLSFPHAGAAKPRRAQAAATFTVNSPNDLSDGACDSSHCSLREALTAANAETGTLNTVAFELRNLLTNPGNEDALVAGGIPGWTESVGQWGQGAGNGASNADPVPFGGRVFFGPVAGSQPTAELTQDVDVSAYAAEIDSATGQQFEFTGYVRSFPQTGAPEDLSRVRVEYLDAAGAALSTFDSGDIANGTRWVPVNDTRAAPALTRTIRVRLTSTRATGTNNNGYYDALSLRAVGRTDQPLAALSAIGPTNTPTAWPSVTDAVRIDGTTQPTFSSTPVVELVGQSDTAVASGLVITSGGTTVRGLAVSGFSANCLHVTTAGGNTIVGNHLGLDPSGTLRKGVPGGDHGLLLSSSGNTVGGSSASERNVISGNTLDGIRITGAGLSANVVRGNYIGTDLTGELDIGNSRHGIFSDTGGGSTTIGGADEGEGNVISGNAQTGVYLSAGSSNVVRGNRIGTDKDGASALGNGSHGVLIDGGSDNNDIGGASGTTPGGACTGACNVISANGLNGVAVTGSGTTGNEIKGNHIGTDITGALDRGNGERGVDLVGSSSSTTVGGTTPEERNIISGNNITGVTIDNSSNNVVQGNYIGTKADGSTALPNSLNGVGLNNLSANNTVGGTAATTPGGSCTGACNVISGNSQRGIEFFSTNNPATPNRVQGNFIGTDANGLAAVPNAAGGVLIHVGSDNTIIGGTTPAERNVISGNGGDGVTIGGSGANTVNNNTVQGNRIGTDKDGTNALGNEGHGVRILSSPSHAATNNTVGGTAGLTPGGACTGACNLIAFNALDGVFVAAGAASPSGNAVRGNSIHSNGGLGIDLGADGLTANDYDDPLTSPADETDADAGANTLQNFPDLTSATSDGVSTTVTGTLATLAGTYTVEFFSQGGCDASGHGEGEVYLGSTTVTLASAGAQAFTATGLASVAPGRRLTATATNSTGNTSEFSSCITDVGTADVRLSNHEGADPLALGSTAEYTLRAYNDGPHEAHNVTVAAPLPAGFAFVGVNVEGDYDGAGCAYNAGSHAVTCNLGTMRVFDNTFDGPVKKGKVKIAVSVTANQLGTFAQAATVDADEPDPDPSDNTGNASTTVLGVSSVEVTPGSVPGGASCQQALVKVTMSAATPTDAFVQLSDDLAATTNLPDSSSPLVLRVPAGRNYATLLLQTVEVAAAQAGQVTAAFGAISASAPLAVRPVGLKSLSVAPASVEGGQQSTGIVKLDCASASGVSVTLRTGKSGVAKFIDPDTNAVVYPLTLTLTNTNQATFTVQTFTVAAPTGVNLSATANGTLKNARLDVLPPP